MLTISIQFKLGAQVLKLVFMSLNDFLLPAVSQRAIALFFDSVIIQLILIGFITTDPMYLDTFCSASG